MKYGINENQVIKIKEETFYRLDNNDLITMFTKSTGLTFLEDVGAKIFKLISQGKTLKEILENLNRNYPDIENKILEEDLIDFLYELEIKGAIEWQKADYINTYKGIVNEKDFRQLSKFWIDIIENKNQKYSHFSQRKEYYYTPTLRTEHMMGNDIYFMISDEKEILTSVSFQGVKNGVNSIVLFNVADKYNSKDRIKELLKYCFDYFKNLDFIKIKFQVLRFESLPLIEILQDIGFKHEATLEKDYKGKDVLIYSLFL